MESTTQVCKVAILVADGFEQVQLACPRKSLRENGATVHIISPNKDLVKGWDQVEWGRSRNVDVPLQLARAEYYDALILPGGVLSVDTLRAEPQVASFIHGFFETQKTIATIGHGLQLLIDTDLLSGCQVTSVATIKSDLINAGADWVDQPLVIDGMLVSSRNNDDLPVFTEYLLKKLTAFKQSHQGMVS